MKILAIETTALTASVALLDDNNIISSFSITDKLTHSQKLMPMIDNVLSLTSTNINDIGLFAVCRGPGSFTGLRIGISTVKGLAFKNNTPCVGVSTLKALAYSQKSDLGSYIICPIMDARRDEYYNALLKNDLTYIKSDRAIRGSELYSELISLNKNVVFLGDGAEKFLKTYSSDLFRLANNSSLRQNATGVALLAYEAFLNNEYTTADKLFIDYLRLPQAEREYNAK